MELERTILTTWLFMEQTIVRSEDLTAPRAARRRTARALPMSAQPSAKSTSVAPAPAPAEVASLARLVPVSGGRRRGVTITDPGRPQPSGMGQKG